MIFLNSPASGEPISLFTDGQVDNTVTVNAGHVHCQQRAAPYWSETLTWARFQTKANMEAHLQTFSSIMKSLRLKVSLSFMLDQHQLV